MRPAGRSEELEEFKAQINLCQYMAARGYELDERKSSCGSAVMRHPSGDKLIVSRGANRHWKYFNVHDEFDQGTIIDFVQRREGCLLGEVRKLLRSWIGHAPFSPLPPLRELRTTAPDRARVAAAWKKAHPIKGFHTYLQQGRQIPSSTLADPVFDGLVRTDHRGGALFAHHDTEGLSGFEIKHHGVTLFSPGGTKSLFVTPLRPTDRELVICETAIDLLSFAALFGTAGRMLVSTAGQVSPRQKSLLQAAARELPAGSTIQLATDNDDAGRKLARTLHECLTEAPLVDITLSFRLPPREGADWNDMLRERRKLTKAFPCGNQGPR